MEGKKDRVQEETVSVERQHNRPLLLQDRRHNDARRPSKRKWPHGKLSIRKERSKTV